MEKRSPEQRQRREVVTEAEYTSALTTIIKRDYFSELPDLQVQLAVLNRRADNDFEGAVRVRRAARNIKNHEEALVEEEKIADEDLLVDVEGGSTRKRPRPLDRENLTGFHSRFTSEDNVEFERTQREEVNANRDRLEAFFLAPHEKQLLWRETFQEEQEENDASFPSLASDEYNPPPIRKTHLEWRRPKFTRNGLFFVPTPAVAIGRNEQQATRIWKNSLDKPSEEDSDCAKSRNRALMPPPSHTNSAAISTVDVSKQDRAEYIPKRRQRLEEKRIEPSQSRFLGNNYNGNTKSGSSRALSTALPQRGNKQNDNYASTATDYSTDMSTDLDFNGNSLERERRGRLGRLRREQQAFVNMTPTIIPGGSVGINCTRIASGAVESSPTFTWGTSSGIRPLGSAVDHKKCAKQKLKSSQHSEFIISQENCREKAVRVAQEALETRRASASVSKNIEKGHNAMSANNRTGKASFSPAAMSLLAKTSRQRSLSSARSGSALASALRPSYTPQLTGESTSARANRLRSSSGRGGDRIHVKR